MTSGTFKQNTFWLIALHIYSILISLIVGPLTARKLGPVLYGDFGYAESIAVIFQSVCILGMNNLLVNELVRKPEQESETIGTALVLRLIAGILGIALSVLTAIILKPGNSIIIISTFLQSTFILLQIYDVFNYWFQAKLLGKYFSIISAIALTIAGIWRFAVAMKNPNVYLFSVSNSIRNIVILIILVAVFYYLNPGFQLKFDRDIAKYLLRRGFHFVLASIGSIIYIRVDKLMVGSMINSENLAYYNVATNLASMWEMIPTTIIASAQPIIMKYRGKDDAKYLQYYQATLAGLFLLSVIACVFAYLLGKPVVLFLYGEAYRNAIPIFMIIMLSTIFGVLDAARSTWIIVEHYEKQAKYFVYLGAITDITMNYVLIKQWGVIGAAYATLLTQIVVFLIAPLFMKETRIHNRIFFDSFKQIPFVLHLVRMNAEKMFKKLRGIS